MGAESMKLSCKRGLHLVFKAHHSLLSTLHGFSLHGCQKHEVFMRKGLKHFVYRKGRAMKE